MTATPFILLGVGFLLIFLEFFLPGGIIGVAGGVFVVLSIVFFSIQTESFVALTVYIIAVIALLAALVKFSLWRIRKGKVKGIFLNTVQEGYVASEYPKELIGKQGKALSDLKPAGHILVEEKRYQAVSKTGYIVKGSKIEVIGGEGAHLVVKLDKHVKENTS